jgi:hypothetical protein
LKAERRYHKIISGFTTWDRSSRLARAGHPHEQRLDAASQPQTVWRWSQRHIELMTLMTEKQVLGFEPAPRLEDIADEDQQRVQDRKHRPS